MDYLEAVIQANRTRQRIEDILVSSRLTYVNTEPSDSSIILERLEPTAYGVTDLVSCILLNPDQRGKALQLKSADAVSFMDVLQLVSLRA